MELENWFIMALFNHPESLRIVKIDLAKKFSRVLKRQSSLNHLAQASRMVIHNSEITNQMLHDWNLVDFESIFRETLCDGNFLDDQNDDESIQEKNSTIEMIRKGKFIIIFKFIKYILIVLKHVVSLNIFSKKKFLLKLIFNGLKIWCKNAFYRSVYHNVKSLFKKKKKIFLSLAKF